MNWVITFFSSSIGKKFLMAVTGLFLISFLVVHCFVNAMIFYNDGGKTFTYYAHFMATNPVIRTIEIVLVLAFIAHIVQGLWLWKKNRDARPVKYKVSKPAANSKWYSRSMALLGTIILLFLVVHTSNFWIPNRTSQFLHGEELPLYDMMLEKFQHPVEVLIYLVGCFSLFWHLLHGFKSAFQSLGLNHVKYNALIIYTGNTFAILAPCMLAMMPVSIYLHWIR